MLVKRKIKTIELKFRVQCVAKVNPREEKLICISIAVGDKNVDNNIIDRMRI